MDATDRMQRTRRHAIATVVMAGMLGLLSNVARAQELPAGWAVADVGAPAIPGYASHANGSYMVSGAGTGLSGTSDQFTFAYQVITGDVSVIVRVGGLTNVPQQSNVGVMIRQGLAANARYAAVVASPSGGLMFKRRRDPGQPTTTTTVEGTAPVWLKLDRRWTGITVSWSRDGNEWTAIGTDTIDMNNALHVGLVSTSATDVAAARGHFNNVAITSLADSGLPLPAGWNAQDVGAPTRAGASAHDAGAFGVKGSGDIGGTADQFHVAYVPFSGDVDVVARVRDIGDTTAASKAGIMLRESLTATAPHAFVFVTPSSGTAFQRRTSAGATSVTTPGSAARTPIWVKLSLRQSTVTAYESLDGLTWTLVGSQSMTLPPSYHVGLAVASGSTDGVVTANMDNVRVEAGTSQNTPPAVSLTAPAHGATFTAPASMTISASASDSDGSVMRVDFYQGATLLGSDATSPYSISWSGVPAGSYSLHAVAVDDGGATTTSASRTVIVEAPANQPPAVSLTSPAQGATFTSPATVALSATASDTDGTIARVEFYRNGSLIGSDTSSPYGITWSGAPAGTYSLTAVAIDNAGGRTVSAERQITVNPRATLAFGPSPDHSTLVTSYVMDVFAAGADPATATPIASQGLGKPPVVNGECTADVTATINGLASGNYQVTVGAVGDGGMTRSAPIAFTR